MDYLFYYVNFIMYNCEYSMQIMKEGKVSVAMIATLYAVICSMCFSFKFTLVRKKCIYVFSRL
jgi:hypothetical protein